MNKNCHYLKARLHNQLARLLMQYFSNQCWVWGRWNRAVTRVVSRSIAQLGVTARHQSWNVFLNTDCRQNTMEIVLCITHPLFIHHNYDPSHTSTHEKMHDPLICANWLRKQVPGKFRWFSVSVYMVSLLEQIWCSAPNHTVPLDGQWKLL